MKLSLAITLLLLLAITDAAPTALQAQNEIDPDLVPITPVGTGARSVKVLPLWYITFQQLAFHLAGLTGGQGKYTYTGHAIYLAAQYGVALQEAKQTRGRNKYPHSLENDLSKTNILSFPSYCPADKNRQEFPLVSPGPYNGGKNNVKQGDERVVYYYEEGEIDFAGHAQAYYCGMITHSGAPRGGFLLC